MGRPTVTIGQDQDKILRADGVPRRFGVCSSAFVATLKNELAIADKKPEKRLSIRAAVFVAFDKARQALYKRQGDEWVLEPQWTRRNAEPTRIPDSKWRAVNIENISAEDISTLCAEVGSTNPRQLSEVSKQNISEAFKIAKIVRQARLGNIAEGMSALGVPEQRGRGTYYPSPYLQRQRPDGSFEYLRYSDFSKDEAAVQALGAVDHNDWVYISNFEKRTCPTATAKFQLTWWDPSTGRLQSAERQLGGNRTKFTLVYDAKCLSGERECHHGPDQGLGGEKAYYATCRSAEKSEDVLNALRAASGTTSLPDSEWDAAVQASGKAALTVSLNGKDGAVDVPFFEIDDAERDGAKIRVFRWSDYEKGLYAGDPQFAQSLSEDELREIVQ